MGIIQDFYSELNRAEVRYVHFKSNTELDASFYGMGDFDVLVSEDDYERMESILTEFGARRFETIKEKRYPYVCSWLIYDKIVGKLYHIHLHKRLVTGKEYVKDYIIPWHNLLLDTRVLDHRWNIYVTEANLELILLAARAVVKSKLYDWKKAKCGKYQLHKDLNKERQELQKRIDYDKLNHYCELLFPDQDYASVIDFCRNREINSEMFLKLSRFIRKNLLKDRRMSPLSAELLSRIHSLRYKVKCYITRKYDASIITKKVLENKQGLIVALVGVDGAGKSTTVKVLEKWLGSQIDSKSYFMGEGTGKTGSSVVVLKKLLGINTKPITKRPVLTHKTRTILRSLIVVLVQQRNQRLLRKMDRYRRKGGISFTDRYPQMESPRMNDGLKAEMYLEQYPSSFILKLFQKLETAYMRKSVKIRPDVVFRLNIAGYTSMKRKPGQSNIAIYQEKLDKLKDITYNNSYIVDIDAEQPYLIEILLLKNAIWKLLIKDSNDK